MADNVKPDSAIRSFFTQQLAALDGLIGQLTEPFAGQFKKLKDQYNDVLKGLPPTDAVPAAINANWHLDSFFSMLRDMQSACSYFASELMTMKQKCEQQLTGLQGTVADFEKKVKDGELVPKATVRELCSTDFSKGELAGEKKVREEVAAKEAKVTLLNERKGSLNAEKLPMPAVDEILSGDDESFKAAKAKAKTRTDELTKKGISLNSKIIGELAWASDADYSKQLEMISSVLSDRGVNPAAFITPPSNEDSTSLRGCY